MQLDSLADIISFGVAPALLVHDIVLKDIDRRIGWTISCIYLVCGAMRLARFNCIAMMDVKSSSKNFRGCPIPAAAGVIASLTLALIWWKDGERSIGQLKYGLAVLMLLLAFLMVSNLEYPSFKSVNWKLRRSFHVVVVALFVVVITMMNWQWMPAVLFVSYLMYGLVRPWVSRKWQREIEAEDDTEDSAVVDPDSNDEGVNRR
jgi:CDP-diacylglycerol--serine O-phosphatidyltransferase